MYTVYKCTPSAKKIGMKVVYRVSSMRDNGRLSGQVVDKSLVHCPLSIRLTQVAESLRFRQ